MPSAAKRAAAIFSWPAIDHGFDFILVLLAQRARRRVDQLRDADHRVVRRIDGRLAAVPQLLAQGRIGQLRAVDQRCRQFIRRELGEQVVHQLVVGPEVFAHPLEPE